VHATNVWCAQRTADTFPSMRLLRIDDGPLANQRVMATETFWERLRGLIGHSPDSAMLVSGRSVHTFGMRRTLVVIALDPESQVVATRRLGPCSVWGSRRARAVLELPAATDPPPVGTTLHLLPLE
jgi:hypothetical protein